MSPEQFNKNINKNIAAAVAAERERCAGIAHAWTDAPRHLRAFAATDLAATARAFKYAAERIEAEIRKPKP